MQLRHRGGSSNNTASNSGNNNQRGVGGGGNDDNHHDLNLTGLLQAGHGGGGVHDIINSLQPINTNYQNLIAHHFSMHTNDGQRGGGDWGTGGGHMHHDWAHDLMSVNTPINYDELFNQLSAATPMITSGQLHRGTSHDVSGGRGIPSTVYVNQLTTAASNDSDDLLTYPSFTPDTNTSHKGSSNSAMQNNNNNNLTSDKKKISDAITYGPKFCEIFYRYCDEMKLHIDTKRHLMSLCIENLIPFICWARDTEERVRWMSNLLFDNDYLRPEVRNGIVIVLIYTFAAIKADHSHSGDMFTVLQDNDYGLGIANRFSLKIYNDPFGYLSCLKFSISSLIDAGAIPENERLNKPFKKGNSKPLPINQDEIQAFQVLKNRITQLLDSDQVNEAKSLVQVVSTHWQFRGNALRTKRFISAIEIMNQPANNVDIATAVYQEKMQLAREGKLVEEPVTTLADIKNMGTVKVNKASRKHGLNSEDGLGGELNTSNITESNKRVKYDDEQSSLPPTGNSSSKVGFALGSSVRSNSNPNFPNSLERIGNSSEKPSNSDLYSSASEGSVGDNKQQQQQQQQFQHQQQQQQIAKLITNPSFLASLPKPFSFKAIRFERIGINEWKMKETIIFDIQQFIHSLLQTQCLTSSSSSTSPVSSSSSSIFHNSIGSDFHVYLLNEKPLTPSMQDGYLRINYTASTPRIQNPNASTSSSMNSGMISGMVSLEHELRKLSTITTSWHLHELPQFQQFLLAYYQQYVLSQASASTTNEEASTATSPKGRTINGGLSLHQFWNQFDHHYHQPASEVTSPLSINTSSSSTVLGCIGYEVSSSMMIIIRENKFLGLQSDIWCRLYPNDFTHAMEELLYPLQQEQQQQQQQLKGKEGEDTTSSSSQLLSNSAKITFGEILMYFFPQLSILERRLMISAQQLSQKKGFTITFSLDDIFVKYAPINSSQTSTQQHQQQVTGDDVSIRSESEGNSNKQSSGSFLPPQSNSSAYQTIGVFTTPAKKILARLQSHTKIHDFILEIDTDFE